MLLGYPVRRETRHRVLYLAGDRPKQIRRAMRRVFTTDDRDVVAARLIVWKGPSPCDIGKHPTTLVELARAADADVVIVDSLKDVAVRLTDDETGSGVNTAVQHALVAGVEVVLLHHQRKAQDGRKPTTIEDVFGSVWITAGAGSVFLLWGAPGDLTVEMSNLKPAAAGRTVHRRARSRHRPVDRQRRTCRRARAAPARARRTHGDRSGPRDGRDGHPG